MYASCHYCAGRMYTSCEEARLRMDIGLDGLASLRPTLTARSEARRSVCKWEGATAGYPILSLVSSASDAVGGSWPFGDREHFLVEELADGVDGDRRTRLGLESAWCLKDQRVPVQTERIIRRAMGQIPFEKRRFHMRRKQEISMEH